MAGLVFRSEEDWWNDTKSTGEAVYEDVWMNEDGLDTVGVVDLFCDEQMDCDKTVDLTCYETLCDTPGKGLTVETDMEWTVEFPSPGKLTYPSLLDITAPMVTPRTFSDLIADLDVDHVFDDNYTPAINSHVEYNSIYGRSLLINSDVQNGVNLGDLVTNSTYNLITYSPFSNASASPKSHFGDDYK